MKSNRFSVFVAPFSLVGLFAIGLRAHEAPSSQTSHPSAGHGAPPSPVVVDLTQPQMLGAPRQLTFVGPRAGEGYFSHDGRLLIFQSEREPQNPFYQIFVMDRESGKSARVSPGQGKTTCSWIHPDKKHALFSSTHLDPKFKEKAQQEYDERKNPVKGKYSWSFDESFDIFAAPIADALKTGKPVPQAQLKRLTTELGYDAEASYSPDGDWIAFASNRAGYATNLDGKPNGAYVDRLSEDEKKIFAQDPSYMMDIYLMRADGSRVERLTTARGYDGGPFFSADGKKITWRRFSPNGQYAEIMTMDLKERKETQLTNMKAMSWAPYFHPSGDYLIFTTNKLGYTNFELFIVDAEGKHEPVRASFLDGFDGLPVFVPKSNEVAWTRKDETGESQIYVADWDDGLARSALGLSRAVPTLNELSKSIETKDLKAWVSYLTSESFKGRRAGSPEERIYTEAIGKTMRAMGLEPVFGKSYVQAFEFTSGITLGPLNRMRIRESGSAEDLKIESEWMPLSIAKSGDVMEAGVVFAGYGIAAPASDSIPAFDSYDGLEVAGKWVVAIRDLPDDVTPAKRFHFNLYARPQHKALVAKQKGAVGLILIDHPKAEAKNLQRLKFEGASEVGVPVVHVSASVAKRLFAGAKSSLKSNIGALDKGEIWNQPLAVSLGGKIDLRFEKSTALNVAGLKRGTDSRLAPVVIGAHGDHLGLGEMGASLAKPDEQGKAHVGADDNASGVAALMELAHATTKNDRDVIFAVWSAEELGVLGSAYFLKNYKGIKPHAYLNMDMIGRLRGPLSIQGVGSASEWRSYFEAWTEHWQLPVTTVSDPYLPTDAMAFYVHADAKGQGIPILSFFTGSHAEYHSPRDRFETLNFDGMTKVTKVVESVERELAKRQSKLTWVKVESNKPSGESRSFRLYLGTVPDYSQEGVKGVKISGTSKESPAESAGLKPGDIIVGLGGIKIESIYDYVYCLQALKADVTIPIQVLRSGQAVEMKITPRLKR